MMMITNRFHWVGPVDARPSAMGELGEFRAYVMQWQKGSYSVAIRLNGCVQYENGLIAGQIKSIKAGKEVADAALRLILREMRMNVTFSNYTTTTERY